MMLQRSYAKLLLRLSRGFCTDQGNKPTDNNNTKQTQSSDQNRSHSKKKFFDKKQGGNSNFSKNQPKDQRQSKIQGDNKDANRDTNQERPYRKYNEKNQSKNQSQTESQSSTKPFQKKQWNQPQKQAQPRSQKAVQKKFDFQSNQLSNEENQKVAEFQRLKTKLSQKYESHLLQKQLQKQFQGFHISENNENLVKAMNFYFDQNQEIAASFLLQQIAPKKADQSQQGKNEGKMPIGSALRDIFEYAVLKFIEKQNLKGLVKFLNSVSETGLEIRISSKKVFDYIELVHQLRPVQKYEVIYKLLQAQQNQPKSAQQLQQKRTTTCHILQSLLHQKPDSKTLPKLFNQILKKDYLSSKSTTQFKTLMNVLQHIYLPLTSVNIEQFLKTIKYIKSNDRNYLEFYHQFKNSLEMFVIKES